VATGVSMPDATLLSFACSSLVIAGDVPGIIERTR
jgi:hypothetical protein